MDRIPAGILSIPPEFLDSDGFRRNSWIPTDSDGIPGFRRIPAGISGGVKSIVLLHHLDSLC